MNLEFSRQIFEKYYISYLMKIFPVGTVLFRADRRIDLKKLIVAFRNSAKEPKQDITRGMTVGPLDVPVLLQSFFHLQNKKKAKISNGE
jgi:hypothetical protein